ncbi:hypothetical protein K8R33_03090 [archaeon]|nr:hypothetical protein [archaeon]
MERTTINTRGLEENFPEYRFNVGEVLAPNRDKYLAVRVAHAAPELAYDKVGSVIQVREPRGCFGLIPGRIITTASRIEGTTEIHFAPECEDRKLREELASLLVA